MKTLLNESNIKELNIEAWETAQQELEAAKSMFNNANNPYYIDIAIKLEDTAKQKLEALKQLSKYESYTTPVKTNATTRKQTFFHKYFDWIIEPIKDVPITKAIKDITWVDLRKAAGFDAKPVANYDDIGGFKNDK